MTRNKLKIVWFICYQMKKRRKDAGEPAKYMGCGDCENLSHSMTVVIDKKHILLGVLFI